MFSIGNASCVFVFAHLWGPGTVCALYCHLSSLTRSDWADRAWPSRSCTQQKHETSASCVPHLFQEAPINTKVTTVESEHQRHHTRLLSAHHDVTCLSRVSFPRLMHSWLLHTARWLILSGGVKSIRCLLNIGFSSSSLTFTKPSRGNECSQLNARGGNDASASSPVSVSPEEGATYLNVWSRCWQSTSGCAAAHSAWCFASPRTRRELKPWFNEPYSTLFHCR